MTKWTIIDGAWTKVTAPPKDLPYFTRLTAKKEQTNER